MQYYYQLKLCYYYGYDNIFFRIIIFYQKGSPTAKCKEKSRLKFGDIIG